MRIRTTSSTGVTKIFPSPILPLRALDGTKASKQAELSVRDRAVLRHILEGLTNREIGNRLSISEGAVKASLGQLFDKLNVRTRAQLVKVALEQYKDQL